MVSTSTVGGLCTKCGEKAHPDFMTSYKAAPGLWDAPCPKGGDHEWVDRETACEHGTPEDIVCGMCLDKDVPEDGPWPSVLTPPYEGEWAVQVVRMADTNFFTVFSCGPSHFTIADGAGDTTEAVEHCRFIRDQFLKALERLGVKR